MKWTAEWVIVALMVSGVSVAGVPETRKQVVTDTIQGEKIGDAYRWLEKWADPAVKAWSQAQNVYAREWLDGLGNREAIGERVVTVPGDPANLKITYPEDLVLARLLRSNGHG